MRFRLEGRSMDPFWLQLPVEVQDERGVTTAHARTAPPDVPDSHEIELHGEVLRFDEIEELFAKHLGETARLRWSLDVEIDGADGRRPRPFRVDGWKSVPSEAVVGPYPRPSFYIRAAVTLEDRTILSQWRIDWEGGFEEALGELRDHLGEATLRACFFCKWSDYEPSASTGHLGCFRAVKPAYEAIATSDDPWTRKYKKESLHAERLWVDELNVCDEVERRPRGFGYRG